MWHWATDAAKVNMEETEYLCAVKKNDRGKGGRTFILSMFAKKANGIMGHLPGAIHLEKGVIERDLDKVIPDDQRKLVLYCGGGFRSALATDNIQKMGYRNVLSMDGGYRIEGGRGSISCCK